MHEGLLTALLLQHMTAPVLEGHGARLAGDGACVIRVS